MVFFCSRTWNGAVEGINYMVLVDNNISSLAGVCKEKAREHHQCESNLHIDIITFRSNILIIIDLLKVLIT